MTKTPSNPSPDDAELTTCDQCGEPAERLVAVEYDGMVDGPGYLMSEDMCERCARGGK